MEGQRVKERFRELEVELVDDGDERTLRRLEKKLLGIGRRAGRLSAEALSRSRFLARPSGQSPLSRDASPQQVVGAALAEQRAELVAHDPGTRLGTDREDLHQMRVATRRARAFLRAARPLLDQEWADELRSRARLAGLGARACSRSRRARRTDARSDRTTGRRGNCGGALSTVSSGAEKGASLRGRRAVGGALPRVARSARRPAATASSTGASSTLAELWWAEFARTRRRFERLDRESSDDELHAARIRVKRTRYAAELAAHELGAPGERFVDAAKVLQDVLGAHQDACVAEEHIRAWAEGKPEAAADAVGKLLERERARRRKARAEWPEAWKLLERRARKARP